MFGFLLSKMRKYFIPIVVGSIGVFLIFGISANASSDLIIDKEKNLEVNEFSAIVGWNTNIPATSRVLCDTVSRKDLLGPPPNYGYAFSTTQDSATVTSHSVTLTDLAPGTTYYWRPVSISSTSTETLGEEVELRTPGAKAGPAIGGVGGEEPGLVLAEELDESGSQEVMEAETKDQVVDEPEEGKIIIEDQDGVTTTATTTPEVLDSETCLRILWFLLVVNVFVGIVMVRMDKKAKKKPPVKDVWLYYLLLALIPVIIGYPNCNLVWWLLAVGVIGVLYLIWRSRGRAQGGEGVPPAGGDKKQEELVFKGTETPKTPPPSPKIPPSSPVPEKEPERKRETSRDDIDTLFPPIE